MSQSNVPNFEYAQERLLERLQLYLKERLDNQLGFSLPDLPDAAMDSGSDEDEGIGLWDDEPVDA